jgi:hypothetical protein
MRRRLLIFAPAVIVVVTVALMAFVAFKLGSVISDQRSLAEHVAQSNRQLIVGVCESGNETRQVLARVLDVLAEPRPDDLPGEYEERQRLRAVVDQFVEPQPCPSSRLPEVPE